MKAKNQRVETRTFSKRESESERESLPGREEDEEEARDREEEEEEEEEKEPTEQRRKEDLLSRVRLGKRPKTALFWGRFSISTFKPAGPC